MINLLREYAMTPAPCGSERKIGALIQEKLSGLDIRVDAHGSIIVHKKGSGDGIVLLCAMDTPCMYITHADENGFLRFSPIGDFKPQKGTLVLLENGKTGIISAEKEKADMMQAEATHALSVNMPCHIPCSPHRGTRPSVIVSANMPLRPFLQRRPCQKSKKMHILYLPPKPPPTSCHRLS